MVCVLNKQSYMTEASRQLDNTKYYRPLEKPLKEETIPKINQILVKLRKKNNISTEQFDYLSAKSTDKDRKFYLLPKIHKPMNKWTLPDMPEGRPIVGDCATESRRISEYIDSFLKPLANKHPSYIKDTYDFIQKIRNTKIQQHYILVTGDVTALYTNMNIDRTISTVKDFFIKYPDHRRPDDELLELLEIALKNNDFSFCNKLFLQIFGTAMGKTFAPNLANIYLIEFDRQAMEDFYINPLDFFRFLDDIFFLWPGTIEQLKQYETFLNSLIPDIRITLTYSDTEINFLDTTIFKHKDKDTITLQTKVYFKGTDTHQLLHSSSFHPKHTFTGILKSQILRFKRLSSYKNDFDNSCKILFDSLRQRGYSKRMLRETKSNIWNNHEPTTKNNTKTNTLLPIVIQYNPLSARIFYEWKKLLLQNETFKHYRIIPAYSRNRNLGELLAPRKPSTITNRNKQMGSNKCNTTNCKTCPYITIAHKFTSTYTRRQYNIIKPLNCQSTNIIYLVTCSSCSKQYVGQTQGRLSEILEEHITNIISKNNTPVAKHFNLIDHSLENITIMPIATVTALEISLFRYRPTMFQYRLQDLHDHWQQELVTYTPHGLNDSSFTTGPPTHRMESTPQHTPADQPTTGHHLI